MSAVRTAMRPLARGQPLNPLCRRGCTQRGSVARQRTCQRLANRAPNSTRGFSSNHGKRPKFSQRLGDALRNSKIQWYQIPVGLGIGFLGLVQFYKVSSREKEKQSRIENGEFEGSPTRRPKVRPEGPWYVACSRALRLRELTRIAGRSRSCQPCRSRPCQGFGASSTNSPSPTTSVFLGSNYTLSSLASSELSALSRPPTSN